MKKSILFVSFLVLGICVFSQNNETQTTNPPNNEPQLIESINLDGPRIGVTYIFPGELIDRLDEYEVNPFLTQFGWQFESRFFTLEDGTAGLVEAVGLIGGLEQNKFLPSASFLIGLRNARGMEIGFGPNISLAGASFVIAAGYTFQSNYINFPVNLAVVPSTTGLRLSLLFGFNARRNKGFPSIF